ncbi:MAG: co-chaperone GroES [Planctomycetes bacterium]|nr:co-chaperone GroES [Planctomycetota bacterium]
MAVKIRPIRDKVVVKRVDPEEKTKGGIILPDTAKDKPQEGIVMAVGSGKILDNNKIREPEVKKNDRVVFNSYAGTEIKLGTDTYLVLSESEIIAVIED